MSDVDDRRAALAAEWAEWARGEARGGRTVAEMNAGIERMNALLIRSRNAGLSYDEIAEIQSRALTETKGRKKSSRPKT